MNHLDMFSTRREKGKSDFIVKHSPTKTRKSSHRKFIHRKFAQHFVCLSAFFFRPSPSLTTQCSFSVPFFMQKKKRKRLQWIEREKTLLIFGLMLFYRSTSIHLSQYSARINHFNALCWGLKTIFIFLLEVSNLLSHWIEKREIEKIW